MNTETNVTAETVTAETILAVELFRRLTEEQQIRVLEVMRKIVDEQ